MAQVSPAHFPEDGKVELASGYKSLIGAFKKVSSYNFTAARVFKKNDKAHIARLQFYNEKEGSFISSPRAYAAYGYLLPLTEYLDLFSGISLGFAGFNFSAPNTTQTSYTLPDGSAGLGIRSEWFELGGSVMQIFNSTFKPVSSNIILGRYYTTYFQVKKEWPSEWFLKGYGLYRVLPAAESDLILTGSFGYTNNLELGLAMKYESGISFFTILGTGIGEDRLKFLLNYNSPLFSLIPKYQSNIEIGLSYLVFNKDQ